MRNRLPDAERQRALLVEALPEPDRAEPAVLVVDARDAARGRDREPFAHRVDVLVVGHGEVPVLEPPAGFLAKNARRLALLVPLDDAARDLEVAVRDREPGRVEPERVVVVGEERCGRVARDAVERLLRRRHRRLPVAVAPAVPADPRALAQAGARPARAPPRARSRRRAGSAAERAPRSGSGRARR